MRAVVYRQAGPAEQVLELVELPDPQPGPGQVRVRLHHSAVNPTDWKRRLAEQPPHGEFQIPNQDGAGVIDMVGAGVAASRIGERVWVFHAAVGHAYGTAAEYVCLDEHQAVPLPGHLSLLQGALIAIPYMTAAHALSFAPAADSAIGGSTTGNRTTVLVQGGAGAVGFAALQVARHAGMRVVTTVSGDEKAAIARSADPDVVLNYRDPDFPERLAEAAPEGYGLVTEVDIDHNLASYVDLLQSGAHVAAYASTGFAERVPVRALMFRNANLHFFVIYALPPQQIAAAVTAVRGLLDAGVVPSLPVREYAMDDAARAHDDVQHGLVGRAVIAIA